MERIILITGATDGIGKATALDAASALLCMVAA